MFFTGNVEEFVWSTSSPESLILIISHINISADYLDEKGGYIITEEMLKGPAPGSKGSASGPSSGAEGDLESRSPLPLFFL